MLSEKGSLVQTPALKLLLSVYEQSLTGILYLKNLDILKVLYFNEGKLVWAISNSDNDKLVNVLIEGNYSNEIELKKFLGESEKDTFGKTLVENGVITLEELIEATKLQLKQIFFSVFRWTEGSFQFTKDSPPQKFLSLELNVVEFASEYIFKVMDISVIWKEIGSLQIILLQNSDNSKLRMYKLSENQTGLLNLFNGKLKLEGIISNYSGVEREIVLKTIYFFIISELLVRKKNVAESPVIAINNNEIKKSDDLNSLKKEVYHDTSDDIADISNKNANVNKKGNLNMKTNESEAYTFSTGERPEANKRNIDNKTVAFNGFDEPQKEKKINLTLIALIIILLLSGIAFVLLKDNSGGEKIGNQIDNKIDKKIYEVNNDSDVDDKTINKKINKIDKIFKNIDKPKKTDVKKEEISVDMKPVKSDESKLKENKKKNGKSALQYFKKGQLAVAIDIWTREIKKNKIKYTILLEVACQKISVKKAFENIKNKDSFFLIRRKIKGRECYRVCWGRFRSKKDAADALSILPKYFFKQESPPEVIFVR